jgi:hypothetical protein
MVGSGWRVSGTEGVAGHYARKPRGNLCGCITWMSSPWGGCIPLT